MKNKLIIFALIITSAILIMAYGILVSGAWFYDTDAAQVAVISTGSLDLQLLEEKITSPTLAPGEEYAEFASFCVTNAGTLDLKYRAYFETNDERQVEFLDYMTLQVEERLPGEWSALREVGGKFAISDETTDLRNYFQLPFQNPLLEKEYLFNRALPPEGTECFRLSVKLADETPNTFQGARLDFVIKLYATQAINPGW